MYLTRQKIEVTFRKCNGQNENFRTWNDTTGQ